MAEKLNKTGLIGWTVVSLLFLGGSVATALVLNKKRKEATIPILIAALKDPNGKYGDARDLTNGNAFNPNYQATSSSSKLDNATYSQAAKDIHDSLSRFGVVAGLGTNSTKILTAIGKAVNQTQVSQITNQYNNAFKSDLLTDLKKDMNSGDFQKVSDLIAKLPA